ncbi:MAG: copper chaperone CopZ [Clostridiales bacterium]|nr:copper chaperone CopZ [Clostridiales bacterium]
MEKAILKVEGMSCSHCEKAVKNAAGSIDGVKSVEVDLSAKTVTVEYDPNAASLDAICDAIEDQGYDVERP